MAKDRADDVAYAVQEIVSRLIREGHPKAAELGWNRHAIAAWYMTATTEGKQLRKEHSELMRKRHGGTPVKRGDMDSAAPLKLTADTEELGSSRRFGEPPPLQRTDAYEALRQMATERAEETGEDFHAAFVEIVREERRRAEQNDEPSLMDIHYREVERLRRA